MSSLADWLVPALIFVCVLALIAGRARSLQRQPGGQTVWLGWPWAVATPVLTIVVVGAAVLVALSAGRHIAESPETVLAAVQWSFFPLVLVLPLVARLRAGRRLITLGRARERLPWLTMGVALLVVGLLPIVNLGAFSLLLHRRLRAPWRDLAISAQMFTMATACLGYALSSWSLTERGLSNLYGFVPWRGVLSYRWEDDAERVDMPVLALEFTRSYRRRWPIPKGKRAAVDRVLGRHREGGTASN